MAKKKNDNTAEIGFEEQDLESRGQATGQH